MPPLVVVESSTRRASSPEIGMPGYPARVGAVEMGRNIALPSRESTGKPFERELRAFLAQLRTEAAASAHTVAAYRNDLLRLAAFCERRRLGLRGVMTVSYTHLTLPTSDLV